MNPETAKLPLVNRDDWKKVVEAYEARRLEEITDQQVIEVLQSVYPTANAETFKTGLKILNDNRLDEFEKNPDYLLSQCKYPQLFIDPESGFFVDDNDTFIDSATNKGWPQERAIKINVFPQKKDILKAAQSIKEGFEK